MLQNTPTYISLFSSAGVGCYGFKLEGFECIATNELLEKRLNIQKKNKKCRFKSGYIADDIQKSSTKKLIHDEIKKWECLGNDRVDVVIATPPCQGMSVANHKKTDNEIKRNSLIKESVDLIRDINPRFFLFENVAAFWKTGCIDKNNDIVSIGDMIMDELSNKYLIYNKIVNFKNYGSNSSRTRTLVIGVDKKISEDVSPFELMPDYIPEKTLVEVIGNMKSLNWGEYDSEDFFHSFRTYPEHMLSWIENLKEGQSAFDNEDDYKKPHRIIDGKLVLNKSKNADKYTRQTYDKVAPCIHTRNDQLASQNTIHPIDNRVFSIRELMNMMTIPSSFRWLDFSLEYLNSLSADEKKLISKKEEVNIRQSIGEAVPTEIFRQIAHKIKTQLQLTSLNDREIRDLICEFNLDEYDKLYAYIRDNKDRYSLSTCSKIIELANCKREKHSAYFTDKSTLQKIFEFLPDFDQEEINVVEPSVGTGNYLPFIFKKYERKKHVDLKVIDIDSNIINLLKIMFDKDRIPKNFSVEFICDDFMNYDFDNVDLIIGNPPFSKLSGKYRDKLRSKNFNKESTNLAEFILEKAIEKSRFISLIMPKTILNTPEFFDTRVLMKKNGVDCIIDFGENGFKGVLVETVNIMINRRNNSSNTKIISTTLNIELNQKCNYIFDDKLPYWIIYRNSFFDKILKKMEFGVFDVFRDRQVTNSNTSFKKTEKYNIRVLKSRNILDSGKIIEIEGYDSYIDKDSLSKLAVSKYINDTDVYLTPNMTYKPRLIKKKKGYIVNGSIAILIPQNSQINFNKEQIKYISSDEFRAFYRIARNYQTRSLNVDRTSCYWFGINKSLNARNK